jgi:methionine-rich copper-binding protein CopC
VPVEAPAFYQFDDSADVPLDFSAGGDADWTVSTTESNSGANSLQAGIITNSQDTTTSIEVSFTTPETVGFWYKVSSENCCDGLSFQVDGGTDLLGFVDGEVDWTFFSTTVAAGAHTLSWTYLKDSSVSNGSDTAWIDDLSFGAPVSGTDVEYNFESGVPVQVSNDDTNPWFTTTSTANDGTTSYQSGSITDGEISAFSITVDLPTAETLSFAYAVSSEPCCDFLRLFVDGTQVQSFANTSGVWATHVQALSSGEHTVEWRYTKDGSVSTGLDAAWVDTIVFGTPAIVDPAGYAFDSAADLDDFVLSGGADWFLQGTTTHSGAMAAQSGDIGDSSTSSMTLTVELTGTQTLSFQYQTSTESCCDGLSFLVDGVEVLDDRNEATWAEYTQVLTAGTYELEWQFFKDFSASSGSDAVWIDALTFTP